MKKTALTLSLLALTASGSIGCKSAPKMPWAKTAKTNDTALAHAAPELPSDAAKKAEANSAQLAASTGKPAGGSTAAASGGYPSTNAPTFTPSAVAANVAPAVASMTGASGPYNPASTPAPKTPVANTVSTMGDRYGQAASDVAGTVQSVPSYSPTTDLASATPYGAPPSAGGNLTPATPASQAPAPYSPAPVTPASTAAVASTTGGSYRPGGTSSYSGVNVASLPTSPTSTPTATPAAGDAAAPAPAAGAAPAGSNRYW